MADKAPTNEKNSGRKSTVKEIVKEGTGLGFLKVLGTALTAVSMAVISARMAGFVNSLMLVALLSVGTAVVNEFYRILLSFTSLGAKKIVAPVLKTTRDIKTGEIIVVAEEPIITETVEDIERQDDINTEPDTETTLYSKMKNRIVQYFKNNTAMRFILVFATVAFITIGINYLMKPEQEPTMYTYTTNHTTEEQVVEKPSDEPAVEEKTTVIVKEQEADEDKDTATNTSSPASSPSPDQKPKDIPTPPPAAPTTPSVENNDKEIQELITRMEKLEEENTSLKEDLKTLQNEKDKNVAPPVESTDTDTVSPDELNKQIEALQEQIDSLKNNQETSSSTRDTKAVQENKLIEPSAPNN